MPSIDQIQPVDIQSFPIPLIDDDPDPIILDLDVNSFTVGWYEELKAFDEADIPGVSAHFFGVVKKWNLTGRDGKILPLTSEGVRQLSIKNFWLIIKKLGEAMTPKEETSTAS